MTREEAIEIIEFEKCHCETHLNDADKAEEFYNEMRKFIEAFEMAIKALEERWISVSERLPEDYQRVLVTIVNYNEDKVVRVAEYNNNRKFFQIKENCERWEVGEKGLLAWMPLPEPYKEESEDEEWK